ncbi:SDR family NAD(P)-dependent oxidoreductase [Bosea sp. PAMC 26642]|uniref:SDR family NAD(P)-dependent oxidoreductase n=1 Tax=Bosea sp. (strain PAMC 26642) TaxID=1792307 RepID=UPI000770194E|nr:SDR family NAD(P)-dependent oxidoreductase [Bosea sp. PAMC 26642]AMJ60200.1 oxidoreductase [Bosea sp. PAMC 26642]
MRLPRMKPQDGVAWITGASSGIGEAVALELARRGWTVAITARRLDQLEEIARRAEGLAGRVVAHAGDVTDHAALQAVVDTVESVHGPIALAFLNAGVAPYVRAGTLDIAAFEQAFAVNALGAAKGIAVALERMKPRRRGQIAVNASIAGYGGLPKAAAYGASKAAAIHMCEALQFDCEHLGIRLQVVNPGFIDTPLTRKNDFPMPFLMSVDEAAKRTVDGFEQGGFEIAFPRRLSWILKAANLLPYPAYFRLVAKATGWSNRKD